MKPGALWPKSRKVGLFPTPHFVTNHTRSDGTSVKHQGASGGVGAESCLRVLSLRVMSSAQEPTPSEPAGQADASAAASTSTPSSTKCGSAVSEMIPLNAILHDGTWKPG